MARSNKPRDLPPGSTAVATNRVARRDYTILDSLEVGIQLRGSEVKALRESKVQLADSYAIVQAGELWLIGLHISAYSHSANAFAHEPDRRRKLLAHRSEIDRWGSRVERENLTLVPLALYFLKGRAKLKLALARGRTRADRRQDIAERDADREAQRAMSRNRRDPNTLRG
ncbi:MAG: SsrA-binding protein SmpB [Acidimicrobiaceae bacterium]|nr:SsrA-binding protein SmpB [Acidimicrobiaceae bacterium]MDE0606734.1 SsrA-binding protein SmpB [Acidimicrobiaceae bacterium]